MGTYNITDFDIQALIDRELAQDQEKLVRAYIETDEKAKERYQQLLRQKELLKGWWSDSGWWQT